jgi:hypothetical protein
MRISAVGLILIVVIFGVLEIGRWNRPELADMLTTLQKARRSFGLAVLLVLGVMAFAGTYWPQPILMPPVFRQVEVLYWLFFALLTVFIPLIAFFEFKDSLKRANQLRRETYRDIVSAPLDQLPKDNDQTKKTRL